MPRAKQARAWTFTLFGWTEAERDAILAHQGAKGDAILRYVVVGKEICPTTDRRHLQGYVQTYKKSTMPGLKRLVFPARVHLEIAKGTAADNLEYCSKEGDFEERGEPSYAGKRTDIHTVSEAINAGASAMDIATDHAPVFYRYVRAVDRHIAMAKRKRAPRERQLHVSWISGPPGCGKTTKAFELGGDDCFVRRGWDMKWFDGYEGERVLIIDEYNNDVPITKMLALLDKWRLDVQIKGGFIPAEWTQVVVTTNLTWEEVHAQAKPAHKKALRRRIHDMIDM